MCTWMCNVLVGFQSFIGRVVRQVNEKETGKGVQLWNENGRGLEMKYVLYGDTAALMAE